MAKRKTIALIACLVITTCIFTSCNKSETSSENAAKTSTKTESTKSVDTQNLGSLTYEGEAFVKINENEPEFTESDTNRFKPGYENYSDLDSLGRCGVCEATVGPETMPTEKRGSIGMIKPTGWHTIKFDFVDGKYLYNRCHLIGYQLTGENANEKNLITGTRYLNIDGMLDAENMVADYVYKTDNHVAYRVTPIFEGDDLLAKGVKMEGKSIEDNGKDVSFNIYAFNVQPGVDIDYHTGKATENDNNEMKNTKSLEDMTMSRSTYILNTKSKKIHLKSCEYAPTKYAEETVLSIEELEKEGYTPCRVCCP